MDWPKVVLLIALAMLLIYFFPSLVFGATGVAGLVTAALMTLFVYYDSRAQGMPPAGRWFWTALMFVVGFFTCLDVPVFVIYMLVTRAR